MEGEGKGLPSMQHTAVCMGFRFDILGYYGGRGYLEQSGEEKRIGGYYLFIFVRIMCAYLLGNGSGGVSNSPRSKRSIIYGEGCSLCLWDVK